MTDEHYPGEKIVIENLTRFFKGACEERKLQIFTTAIDRHGSLVWEAGWEHNGSRYLTLSVTQMEPLAWQIELWVAAADDEKRTYTRAITYQNQMTLSGFLHGPRTVFNLPHEFSLAIAQANALQPGTPDVTDIPETTIFPQIHSREIGFAALQQDSDATFREQSPPLPSDVAAALRGLKPDYLVTLMNSANEVNRLITEVAEFQKAMVGIAQTLKSLHFTDADFETLRHRTVEAIEAIPEINEAERRSS